MATMPMFLVPASSRTWRMTVLMLLASTNFADGLVGAGGVARSPSPLADASCLSCTSSVPPPSQKLGTMREETMLGGWGKPRGGWSGPFSLAGHGRVGWERVRGGGRGKPKLVASALLAGKIGVGVIGSMWCWGCLHGLWSVARVAMAPGGLEWIEEQSSHGLVGVLRFVAFTTVLLCVQLVKLWSVVVATSTTQVKRSFICLAVFNIFFVYMCSWRVSPGLQSLSIRDAVILAEAVCMVGVVALHWLNQPWRGKGRRIGA